MAVIIARRRRGATPCATPTDTRDISRPFIAHAPALHDGSRFRRNCDRGRDDGRASFYGDGLVRLWVDGSPAERADRRLTGARFFEGGVRGIWGQGPAGQKARETGRAAGRSPGTAQGPESGPRQEGHPADHQAGRQKGGAARQRPGSEGTGGKGSRETPGQAGGEEVGQEIGSREQKVSPEVRSCHQAHRPESHEGGAGRGSAVRPCHQEGGQEDGTGEEESGPSGNPSGLSRGRLQ